MEPRILIVDDHEVVRQGVRRIISQARPHWVICGEAGNGQEAVAAVSRMKPDLVLLDITMPGMSGLDAATRIGELGLDTRILIFTMHQSGELGRDAKSVGARGYVTKSEAARDLIRAIEKLLAGGTFFGPPEESTGNTGTMLAIFLFGAIDADDAAPAFA